MNRSALYEGVAFVAPFADEFEEDDTVEVIELTDVASELPPSVCPPCLDFTFFLLNIFLMSMLLLLDLPTGFFFCVVERKANFPTKLLITIHFSNKI